MEVKVKIMTNPISIFILDVSNSSSEDMGETLTGYLDDIVHSIIQWTKNIGHIKVRHRSGDEIIFVGYGYSTAYIIAFFISSIWKFPNHKPYFGLSFGDIESKLENVDIEKWIHPLIKQARYANDLTKQEQVRTPFKFELDQFYPSDSNGMSLYHPYRKEFERLFNTLLQVQHSLVKEQTDIQKRVCSLYFIFQQQKAVGKLLGKTPPTISSHYKKGKCEEIISIFHEIMAVLQSLEEKSNLHTTLMSKEDSDQLMVDIRDFLKAKLDFVQ
jgi:hypothetical protein